MAGRTRSNCGRDSSDELSPSSSSVKKKEACILIANTAAAVAISAFSKVSSSAAAIKEESDRMRALVELEELELKLAQTS